MRLALAAAPARASGDESPHALAISAAHAALIDWAARRARPLEYCAALIGCVADGRILVADVLRMRNSETRAGRFSVADAELDRAATVAREIGQQLVAILHSHAFGPPVPSGSDLRTLSHSAIPWVIAGFDDGDVLRLAAFEARTGASLPIACADRA